MRNPTDKEMDHVCALLAEQEESAAMAELCEKRLRREHRQPMEAQLTLGGEYHINSEPTGVSVTDKQLETFKDLTDAAALANAEVKAELATLRRKCGISDARVRIDPNSGKWMKGDEQLIKPDIEDNGKAKRGKRTKRSKPTKVANANAN